MFHLNRQGRGTTAWLGMNQLVIGCRLEEGFQVSPVCIRFTVVSFGHPTVQNLTAMIKRVVYEKICFGELCSAALAAGSIARVITLGFAGELIMRFDVSRDVERVASECLLWMGKCVLAGGVNRLNLSTLRVSLRKL